MEFDSVHERLFLSDDTNSNYSIFTLNLQGNQELTPFIKRADNHKVRDIAYDFVSDALYWTGETAVYWYTNKMKTKEGQILHKLGNDDVPHGITVDSCRRYVYWTNSFHLFPTIERSLLDGSQREIIINKGLFQPMGIAVDTVGAKLYWSDDQAGIYYNIKRANLDGSNPETIKHGTHHEPFYLAINGHDIFWSDLVSMAVWKMPKEASKGEQPTKFYQYVENRTPQGIVAWSNGKPECPIEKTVTGIFPKIPNSEENYMSDGPGVTAETEQLKETPGSAGYCLNAGVLLANKKNSLNCHCPQGYAGERCEVSLCHNYCLNGGKCEMDANDAPVCVCLHGTKGPRCEQKVCNDDFCLNGAKCVVNDSGQPTCKCNGPFSGVRCEILVSEHNCYSYCQQFRQLYVPVDGEATRMCICPSTVSTNEYELVPLENSSSLGNPLVANAELNQSCLHDKLISDWVSVALGSLCFILVIAVFLLLKKVFVLRKRPRIKKRIIVNKNVTPLTSRPSLPPEQCEITIENCCNMNICETPCFEPQLRTPKSSRIEEKKTLLGSMEEAPTSSPCQEDLY
ncbi:protein cueball isoform X2 [Periplaneta americana]